MAIKAGIHEDFTAAQTAARFPQVTYTREFVDDIITPVVNLRAKLDYYGGPAWAAGLTPIISFRFIPADVNAGSWDAHLRDLGTYLLTKPETLIVIWHEPEDDADGLVWQTQFNRCRNNLKLTNPNVKVGTSHMAYHWNWNGATDDISYTGTTNASDAYKWRVQADFYGIDCYSGFEYGVDTILPEISGFNRWLKFAVPEGAPIMLLERGFKISANTTPQHDLRITAINRESDWLISDDPVAQRIVGYVYWSSTGVENDPLMVLNAAEVTALGNLFTAITTDPPVVADRYDEGVTAGYSSGYTAGNTAGYTAGNTAGYASGHATGLSEGLTQAGGGPDTFPVGYRAGLQDALNILQALNPRQTFHSNKTFRLVIRQIQDLILHGGQ